MIPGLQRDHHRQRGDDLQYHLFEEHRGDQLVFSKITQFVKLQIQLYNREPGDPCAEHCN